MQKAEIISKHKAKNIQHYLCQSDDLQHLQGNTNKHDYLLFLSSTDKRTNQKLIGLTNMAIITYIKSMAYNKKYDKIKQRNKIHCTKILKPAYDNMRKSMINKYKQVVK